MSVADPIIGVICLGGLVPFLGPPFSEPWTLFPGGGLGLVGALVIVGALGGASCPPTWSGTVAER
jgi:hypothetical protein